MTKNTDSIGRALIIAGKITLAGLVLPFPVYLSNCDIFNSFFVNGNYSLKNASEQALVEKIDRPYGLSSSKSTSKNVLSKSLGLEAKIFCSATIPPRVYTYSNGIESIFYEFGEKDSSDFKALSFSYSRNVMSWGLIVDTIVLRDGSILVSSNVSNKIFKITPNKDESIYIKDDRLFGINSMILGSDNKIYCAQSSIKDKRPKRIISIDANRTITEEFSLPIIGGDPNYMDIIFSDGEKNILAINEQVKIAENSDEGKLRSGFKFYVTDMNTSGRYESLKSAIYGVSENNIPELITDKVRLPTSINVDKKGNPIVTTSPILDREYLGMIYSTELDIINPDTGEISPLYTFDEQVTDYKTGFYVPVILAGDNYETRKVTPVGFAISSVLSDTDTSFEFWFTNSLSGKLKSLTATK